MADNDPGNSGGSIVIPPSPISRFRNWQTCETCGLRFDSPVTFDAHVLTHVSLHPTLVVNNREVPSSWVVAEGAAIQAIEIRAASRIELDGAVVSERALPTALRKMNGRPEFDLVLVGGAEHIRSVYRLQIVLFDAKCLARIEVAYADRINGESSSASDLLRFAQGWHDVPERAFADALVAYRLAVLMRDQELAGAAVQPREYRHHLAECRRVLAAVSTPLARTVIAACGFMENDFFLSDAPLRDSRIEDGQLYFQQVITGRRLSWSRPPTDPLRLAIDANSARVLDAVECFRSHSKKMGEQVLSAVLEDSIRQGDYMTAKKATAALHSMDIACRHIDVLAGDPIFEEVLKRDKNGR